MLCVFMCVCSVCERVTPRLSHANAAVVLSAVKVLMRMAEAIPDDSPFLNSLGKKLAPPLGGCGGGHNPIVVFTVNFFSPFSHAPLVPAGDTVCGIA